MLSTNIFGKRTRQVASGIFSIMTALVATVSISAIAKAGTIRHDVDDWYYRNFANYFPSVGYFSARNSSGSWGCSGTLIGYSYMLTAAHCLESNNEFLTNGTFWLGGSYYSVAAGAINSEFNNQNVLTGNDIAVTKLARSVFNVQPATLYSNSNEDLKTGTYVGFGATGNGLTGYDPNTGGTKRAGQNTIGVGSRLSNYGFSSNLLISDFDDPRTANADPLSQPLGLEYQLAPGDSGGGLFIDGKVAGVHSFISGLYDNQTDSSYTDISASTRVSSFNGWISDAISVLENLGIASSSSASSSDRNTGGGGSWSHASLAPQFNYFDDSYQVSSIHLPNKRSVPEPSTVVGLLLGASLLGLSRRRYSRV